MGWKERLRPASWRSIAFFVDDSELAGGRKTVEHDFPQRNIPYIEDLGRRARTFNISAYVLGENYDRQRDALLQACEQPGIGDLVHPRYGKIKAQITEPIRIRERNQDGRIAVFDLVFSQSEDPTQPIIIKDTGTNLFDKINNAIDTVVNIFEAAYDVFQKAQNIIDDVSATVNNLTVALETIKRNGKKALTFQDNFQNLINNSLALIYSAEDFANVIDNLLTTDPSFDGILENLKLKDFQADQNIIEPNNKALNEYIRQMAVIGAANATTGTTLTNVVDAYAIRDLVSDALDSLMETADEPLYSALYELRIAVIEDINARADQLPQLLIKTLVDSIPGLFLAYDLYEDTTRMQEIIDRNNIIHPGFVPGGIEIEVLSRE